MLLHSRWIVLLQVQWSILQWTVCVNYCTVSGLCYCRLNGVCFSENYLENTAQQVDSFITSWMECVTVNNMCKLLHNRWTVVLQVVWCMLQWTLIESYCTAVAQWNGRLNWMCKCEHCVEGNAQKVDSVIAGWMECVKVNIMRKVLNSRWTELLQFEWSVIQWKLFVSYYTAGGQFYFSLNGLVYSEHYVEGTAQLVDSSIAARMVWFSVSIMWNLLHSKWTVLLQVGWSVIHIT